MHRTLTALAIAAMLGCSREAPAPPPPDPSSAETTGVPELSPTETSVPQLQQGTYDEALLWMRSAKRFDFVVDEDGVRAEGEMTRSTPGSESILFSAGGVEWQAESTPQGVEWKRRDGAAWKSAAPPPYGSRLYQRITVVFDPQKREGVPMLVSTDGDRNLYRFTDANSGALHEMWVRKADSSIARIRIGESMEMTLQP